MPMNQCPKCLENRWYFQVIEVFIRATCQNCGAEAEWESEKLKRKAAKVKAGDYQSRTSRVFPPTDFSLPVYGDDLPPWIDRSAAQ